MRQMLGLIGLTIFLFLTSCQKKETLATPRKVRGQVTNYSDLNEAANEEFLACAKETCGLAPKLPYHSAQPQQADVDLYKSHVEELFNQYLDIEAQTVQAKHQVVTRFKNLEVSAISDDYRALINLQFFLKYWDVVAQSLVEQRQVVKVNVPQLKSKLENEPSAVADWIISCAKAMFESPIFQANNYLSHFPLEIFVQKIYPGKDELSALSQEAQQLKDIQAKFIKTYPMMKASHANRSLVLEKAIKKEPLAPDEKKEFIESRFSLLSIQEILPEGKWRKIFLSRPTKPQDDANTLLKSASTSRSNSINQVEIAKEKNLLKFVCTQALLGNVASSPTPEQNQRFLNLVQNVKNEAIQVLSNSRYNTSAIYNSILATKLIMPPTKQQTATALARALKQEVETTKDLATRLSKLDPNSQEDKEVVLLILASEHIDETPKESSKVQALKDVLEFCDENMADQIADAAYSRFQTINIGWRSVLYPQFGYGILAHELGHIVSEAAKTESNKTFMRAKNCLKSNLQGNEDLVEEEFADLFAAQLIKLKPDERKNYSCLLLSQDGGEYADLKMSTRENVVHAASFYRLISIGTQVNNLTPACQTVKETNPIGKNLVNCWGI